MANGSLILAMSTCLIIDTSNRWLVVAVAGTVSAEVITPAERRASTELVSLIAGLLRTVELKKPDWIVCLRGPGSFTGARIGVSTARNLAQLWKIPVLGLDTTAAYAYSCLLSNEGLNEICVQMDGKQSRVYARRLLRSSALVQIQTESPLDVPPAQLWAKYPHAKHFVDDEEAILRYLGPEGRHPIAPLPPPRPEHFAALAALLGGESAALEYGALVPLYLRNDPASAKFPEGFPSPGV